MARRSYTDSLTLTSFIVHYPHQERTPQENAVTIEFYDFGDGVSALQRRFLRCPCREPDDASIPHRPSSGARGSTSFIWGALCNRRELVYFTFSLCLSAERRRFTSGPGGYFRKPRVIARSRNLQNNVQETYRTGPVNGKQA